MSARLRALASALAVAAGLPVAVGADHGSVFPASLSAPATMLLLAVVGAAVLALAGFLAAVVVASRRPSSRPGAGPGNGRAPAPRARKEERR